MWPLEIAAKEEMRGLVSANRSSWPSAASAAIAMAGCRRMPSGWREARGAGCRATCCSKVLRAPTGKPATAPARGGSEAERMAREARRGLWADAAYERRPAGLASRVSRYRSTFQVVEGRIARVAQGPRHDLLNSVSTGGAFCGLAAARRSRASRAPAPTIRRRSRAARARQGLDRAQRRQRPHDRSVDRRPHRGSGRRRAERRPNVWAARRSAGASRDSGHNGKS